MHKKIEDVINEKLTGESKINALDLIVFMKDNGFSFDGFETADYIRWTPIHNGKGIGCVAVGEESMLSAGVCFALWLGLDCVFENGETAGDELKNFVWEHVVSCPQEPCKPPFCENSKNRWSIFGKDFESTCHAPLAFFKLDNKALENIKKLLLTVK